MLIVSTGDTDDSLTMISDAIAAMGSEYEPWAVAQVVIMELYEHLLVELDLDYEAANEIMCRAARHLEEKKTSIGQEIAANHWLN